MNLQQLIQSYPTRFKSEKAGLADGIFHFDISGQGAGKFTVQLEHGGCKISNSLNGHPVCLIQTDRLTLLEIENGTLDLDTALRTKRLRTTNRAKFEAFVQCFAPLMIKFVR